MAEQSGGAEATTIVIFGASGDLTRRKLIPSLFHLARTDRLPEGVQVLGLARSEFDDAGFRSRMESAVQEFQSTDYEAGGWDGFAQRLHYLPGNFKSDEDFEALKARLNELEGGPANRLYYLATPPAFYGLIAKQLSQAGMADHSDAEGDGGGWRRIVVEKPFGSDLATAHELNATLHACFAEDQIYRIDHYLGKETAQNILFFRFANSVFEPVWNRSYIDHIQITVAESVDIGDRGGYYDEAGVVRDMFQNHLLQLAALIGMEPPVSFGADAIRDEKVKFLRAIRDLDPETVRKHTVSGQYEGYRNAEDVAPDSQTATFGAVRLEVDNWRWQGVPFFLRSGKAMAEKSTEIIVSFKCPPHLMFPLAPGDEIRSNMIAICIQPHEGIHLRFEVKVPETLTETRSVDMEFHYSDAFGEDALRDAYVRLLLDAIKGDASLFARSDGIERSWEVVDPIVEMWESGDGPQLETYERGSWGPEGSPRLIGTAGQKWVRGCAEKGGG